MPKKITKAPRHSESKRFVLITFVGAGVFTIIATTTITTQSRHCRRCRCSYNL